jgi:6-phosphogluconolactonase
VWAVLPARGAEFLVYAGTYTTSGSQGIYAYRFETRSGKLTPLGLAAATSNPSFLVEHPNHRFLYAVNEGGRVNTVSAFAIDPATGKLTLRNAVSAHGDSPCHISLDRTGRWLAVANYESGTVAVLPVESNGTLGEAVAIDRHEGAKARAHAAVFSPDNRFLLSADLGLDRIFVYRFDPATGSITANDPPFAAVAAGAGVRHLAFHPGGKWLYAINETASTITAFQYDAAKGVIGEFQSVPAIPVTFKRENSTAEIVVNSAGTVLYGSNRGHDSIALFAIDPVKGTLAAAGHAPTLGRTPRHFAIDPSGGYLLAANQDSNSIAIFRIHPATSQLVPAGRPLSGISHPVSLVFVPLP